MTESTEKSETPAEPPPPDSSWSEFLTALAPGTVARIPDLVGKLTAPAATISTPDLILHCSSEACRGERIFAAVNEPSVVRDRFTHVFLTYSCRNCGRNRRLYALYLKPDEGIVAKSGLAIKIGEWPPFGPPTPARLVSMIGPDRDLFLKGRRGENLGLGLGAYAYYRRVVEEQRSRLLGEIIRVAKKVGTKPEMILALECAAAEQQFSKSLELTKGAIPDSLLIDGHNPLLLLHRALSFGLHEGTDEECLSRARSIRLVLAELAERISTLLKDTAELREAVSELLQEPRSDTGNSTAAG